EDVTIHYGPVAAVRNISLEVAAGEAVSLVGPNGAGKSTTLNAIAGVLKPSSGQLLLDGVSIAGTRPELLVRQGIALVPEGRRMLLDEPSLGLAPTLVDRVFEVLQELRNDGATILLVEQSAMRAVEFADRSYVMATGRVVMSGTRDEVLSDTALQDVYLGPLI